MIAVQCYILITLLLALSGKETSSTKVDHGTLSENTCTLQVGFDICHPILMTRTIYLNKERKSVLIFVNLFHV